MTNKDNKPLRNCDVGTAEEQYKRWRVFCDEYGEDCTGCQFDGHPYPYCFAEWAQMPYEPTEQNGGGK